MLVCTLPSPACMCSATHTRPRSTSWWIRRHSASSGSKAAPLKMDCRGLRICVFQEARSSWVCRRSKKPLSRPSSQPCHSVPTSRSSAKACCTRSSSSSALGISPASSLLPSGSLPVVNSACSAVTSSSLLRSESSMLMRSMPSVYSPMRGSGITTSSFTLNAFVCLLMAAVRLRSSQNFLRASALTATKPSPERPFASRTTSLVARATASASSPTMSPTSTILGRPPRLLLVA
mmetsp:Transcript_50954/g.119441  ORF Transcript_50954/g.119441 Transcript_50954/m.119441 type:complete len:234 (+) Transcript_50954:1763-2464(+)